MWPKIEKKLYTKFVQRRAVGIIVRRGWFQRQARKLWVETYLRVLMLFVFSNSWFQGFYRQFNITLRAITRQVRAFIIIFISFSFILIVIGIKASRRIQQMCTLLASIYSSKLPTYHHSITSIFSCNSKSSFKSL